MKFQKPSYPYILVLAALFIAAALQSPEGGNQEISIPNTEQLKALDSETPAHLFYADITEEL